MKKKMLFIIPICTAALISVFVVSFYAATAGDKLDSSLSADPDGGKVTDISDQVAARSGYYDEIQRIAQALKNAGKIISDEQIQKLDELYAGQSVNPTIGERLLYQEGIIFGDVDPNAPKLDLAAVKDIIAGTDSFEEIVSEFEKIQEYPDYVGGSGVSVSEYLFSNNEGGIVIIHEQKQIYYETFNSDGTSNSTEMLFG